MGLDWIKSFQREDREFFLNLPGSNSPLSPFSPCLSEKAGSWMLRGIKRRIRDWLASGVEAKPAEAKPAITRYVLKKYYNRAWRKLGEYPEFKSPEDLAAHLQPGRYRLDEVDDKGVFKTLWSIGIPDETGRVPIFDTAGRKGEGVETLPPAIAVRPVDVIKSLNRALKSAKSEYEELKKFFEARAVSEEDIFDAVTKAHDRWERLGKIFGAGERIKKSEEPIYEGKIPMWLHPKVIPGLAEEILDSIERRASRWGLISPEIEEEELIKLPHEALTVVQVTR